MPTQMFVITGPDKGRSFALVPGTPLVIGRGTQTATKLADPHTSRAHCEVRWDGKKAVVVDNNSTAGTFVNGQQISSTALRAGDVIRVGETELRFDCELADDTTLPPTKLPLPPPATPRGPLPVARPVHQPVPAAVPQAPAAAAPSAARPLPPPPKGVVLANKAGGRPMLTWVQQLHDLAGKTLGRFQLTKVLGDGSSGVVFLARDTAINQIVALKVFRPEFGRDEKGRQRFVRGMTSAIHLIHDNLVTLYDAGLSTSYCWISMQYVPGESLAELLRKPESARPDWKKTLPWAKQIATALQFLHGNGVLHRNVLPNNILIRASDQVAKLGDVMLAKAMEDENDGVSSSGELVGNIYYMAPERTTSDGVVDGRSDLYSLGATWYNAVTGRRPIAGTSMIEVITKIRDERPEPPRKLNRGLPQAYEMVLLKLLEKQPEKRHQNATELLRDLEKVGKA